MKLKLPHVRSPLFSGRSEETPLARPARPQPRGFMLAELTVAAVFLALVMVLVAQLLSSLALLRRDADRRELATQEVANLMEQLTAWPVERLTTENASALALSETAQHVLPKARLNVTVSAANGSPKLKRIAIEVRWRGGPAGDEAPVRLTAWVGPRRRAKP